VWRGRGNYEGNSIFLIEISIHIAHCIYAAIRGSCLAMKLSTHKYNGKAVSLIG
jgi:hypothetical protein